VVLCCVVVAVGLLWQSRGFGGLGGSAEGAEVVEWLESLSLSAKARQRVRKLLLEEDMVTLNLVAEYGSKIQEMEAFSPWRFLQGRAGACAPKGTHVGQASCLGGGAQPGPV